MTYEEKRELRLQISQLLSDAGLNQGKIREMVDQEIKNKVDRALEQCIKTLNAECSSGDYIKERIGYMLKNTYLNQRAFDSVVKDELKSRVIKVVLENAEQVGV